MKDTDKNAWSTAFVEILEHLRGPLNVLMDTNNPISITNLENAVSALTTVIIYTNEQVAKKCNPSPTAKPWWNKTLTEIAAYIRQLRELQCEHLKTHGFRDLDLNRDIKQTRNLFKRQVQYAKGMWANETLEKATVDKVWKLHRWTTEHRNYPIPAISRGPGQSPAITHKEKYKTLRATLYQEPPLLPIPIEADLSCRQDNKIPFEKVTYTEVQEALFASSSNTAAGTSQINYTILK